ncbi:hypothetical protein C0J52_00680 [Blattella germanica]|nr:hypothetical protein C0J52_00680 [Blattella germanica]
MALVCSLLFTFLLAACHAKRNYYILINEVELISTNEDFYSDETDFDINKINETTDAISATLDLIKDLPEDVGQIIVQSYELHGNKWDMSGFVINKTWCDFIGNDPYFMEGIIRQSNYPKKCPIQATRFEVNNFTIDAEQLPEEVPGEFWRFVFQQYQPNSGTILQFRIDAQIKRKQVTGT